MKLSASGGSDPSTAHCVLRGHCICFLHSGPSVAWSQISLLERAGRLSEQVQVVFVGAEDKADILQKYFAARMESRVRAWVVFNYLVIRASVSALPLPDLSVVQRASALAESRLRCARHITDMSVEDAAVRRVSDVAGVRHGVGADGEEGGAVGDCSDQGDQLSEVDMIARAAASHCKTRSGVQQHRCRT